MPEKVVDWRDAREVNADRVREVMMEKKGSAITDPVASFELLKPWCNARKEHVLCIYLDSRRVPLGPVECISIGTVSTSLVHPREVLREAIVRSASGFILAHTHPSGDPTPSPDDLAVTRRIRQAGEIVGIELLDHIILGRDCWVSLKERGEF